MIRIIAELRDGGRVEDLASGPISGTELMWEFDAMARLYGSRPFEIRLEAEEITWKKKAYRKCW